MSLRGVCTRVCARQAESQAFMDDARRQEAAARGALDRLRADLDALSLAVGDEQRRRAALVEETDALGRARGAAEAARAAAEAETGAARCAAVEAEVRVIVIVVWVGRGVERSCSR